MKNEKKQDKNGTFAPGSSTSSSRICGSSHHQPSTTTVITIARSAR